MSSKVLRCALLASFTLDGIPPQAKKKLDAFGITCDWFIAPFNQYSQLILSEDSDLINARPDVVFLAVALEDLLEHLPSGWTHGTERKVEADRRIADFMSLVGKLVERLPSAIILVHEFLPMVAEPLPVLTARSGLGLRSLALNANQLLADLAAMHPNLHVVSLTNAFHALSPASLYDSRYYYLAKIRLSQRSSEALAEYYCRLLLAYAGLRKKCLVLDLDNTLWGGILGEDGMDGLRLGDDGVGKAFRDTQRILLDYYETGTLLAICSKNDESLAMTAVREHPGMILRPHHFAALRINWQDKASNLLALANELNIGLDSLVFLDDSPFECAEVRRLAPQVTVLQMPDDPADYPAFVAELPYFDALGTTEDDRRRSQMYVEDRQRRQLETQAETLEDFLKGLEIKVEVHRSTPALLPRVAQLTQRTNQFNLTTRRYTESDLKKLLVDHDRGWRFYAINASDRIGDTGITGAALVFIDLEKSLARLDTFLLSCRVLGRGIESAFLSAVISDLHDEGVASIVGEYISSDRNGVARDFLSKHGFGLDGSSWRRPVAGSGTLCPHWISLKLTWKHNNESI